MYPLRALWTGPEDTGLYLPGTDHQDGMNLSLAKVPQHCSPYDDFLEELTGNYSGLQGGCAALSWELGQAYAGSSRTCLAFPRPPPWAPGCNPLKVTLAPLQPILHVAEARGESGN